MFSRDLFCRYESAVKHRSRWWTRALRVCQVAYGSDVVNQALAGKDLWSAVGESGFRVGGLDLLPFHSTRDGVTPLLLGSNLNAAETRLRDVALETLSMAIRHLRPRLLLVVSKSGAQLMQSLAGQLGLRRLSAETAGWPCAAPWDAAFGFVADSGTRILCFPHQVFARLPGGYTRIEFGRIVRAAAQL